MKRSLWVFVIVVSIFPNSVWGQSKYEATPASMMEAIARGEAREALAAMEAKGSEAEKNVASSASPQRYRFEAANAYREAARAAQSLGQFQKAISHGSKALEMADKTKNPALQAGAIYQLQQSYRSVGNHAKARELVDKGLEVTKQIPEEGARRFSQAGFLRELGIDLLRQGKREEAIQHTSESLRLLEDHWAFLKSRADVRLKFPNAVRQTENNLVYTLYRLGLAYQRAGKVEDGIRAYERGLSIIKETGLKTQVEVNLYWGLGDLYLRKKEFPGALENLQKTLELSEQLRLATFIYLASSQLGDLYLQTQKPAEAIPYYKKAIDNIESTRALLESEELRSSYFDDKRATYGSMIVAQLRTKNPAEAFNYSERARSRAFLDILGSKVQLARSGTLLEHERALQARISVLQAMMAGQGPDASEGPRLRQEVEEAQKAYADFLTQVRKENKEQASLINVEPLNLKQVQELLDPGVTMLEYFVVRGAVLLWVVEKERIRFVNIPIARTDLVSKVTSFRDTVYQIGEKEKFRGISQELYRLLVEPALPHIRGKEVLVVPHDVLHYLPFQALLSDKDRYLIREYPVYYLSSASLMQFTHEKRRAGGERALIMGNPSLGDEAYNLRFAEREAKEVASVYPKSEVYLKAEANKPRAVSLSPKNDVLHFAVHAELDETDPMGSALLLAAEGKDDGRLRVGEIFALDLKAGMVVLSACETGLGKLSNGDELIGLTRAFIYAGTPSIVTTLWRVNDRSSYELMREFYRHLKTGKKAEALRQAQLTTMKEFPEPFYWAAYQLTGEP
jgi:CHAT domain-containing protein/lipopolysaccharide biosynthesis regulator YciM